MTLPLTLLICGYTEHTGKNYKIGQCVPFYFFDWNKIQIVCPAMIAIVEIFRIMYSKIPLIFRWTLPLILYMRIQGIHAQFSQLFGDGYICDEMHQIKIYLAPNLGNLLIW